MSDTEMLPVKMTPAERNTKAVEMADLLKKLDLLAEEAREASSSYRQQIQDLKAQVSALCEIVHTGYEHRAVDVSRRLNLPGRVWETVRVDTLEIVSIQPLTEQEVLEHSQGHLFPEEEP